MLFSDIALLNNPTTRPLCFPKDLPQLGGLHGISHHRNDLVTTSEELTRELQAYAAGGADYDPGLWGWSGG